MKINTQMGKEPYEGEKMANSSPLNLPHQTQDENPNPIGQSMTSIQVEKNNRKKSKQLTLIPLIFLIYFEVCGGPSGSEPAVAAGGPLLALLGFLIFPFLWCIPEALITAELCTTFPGNGGFVIWADQAFGPFWASLMGSWKFLSGAIDNGAYAVLCMDYLQRVFPAFSGGLPRHLAIAVFNLMLAFLNYTGLTIVGYAAIVLAVLALLPFFLMTLISIPRIHPKRWTDLGDHKKDWRLYFNTLFWNLNFWDNVSTLAGEVDCPQRTIPKALFASGILTCFSYLIPLLGATGALVLSQGQWMDGFLADAAGMIAGSWLKLWVEVGSVLSAAGLFEAQLTSCAFQLLGMADLGFLPSFVGLRSKRFDTPWVAILISSALTLGVSYMSFTDIIESATFIYGLGMLLEFASFVWLRNKFPAVKRPFKVPVDIPGVVCMCLFPTGFLIFVMAIARKMVYVISAGLTMVGIVGYFVMGYCKKIELMEFKKKEEGRGEVGNLGF